MTPREFAALRPGDVVALRALPSEHWRVTRALPKGGYAVHFAGTGWPSSGRDNAKMLTPAAWARVRVAEATP